MSAPKQLCASSCGKSFYFQRSKGFTLVELLMVLAIIGILVGLIIPVYNHYINSAKRTVAVSTLDSVRKNLESYYLDYQEYPPPPINFLTGMDSAMPPRNVFSILMLEQINDDISTIVSYVRGPQTYTLTVKARDRAGTVITLTPQDITY